MTEHRVLAARRAVYPNIHAYKPRIARFFLMCILRRHCDRPNLQDRIHAMHNVCRAEIEGCYRLLFGTETLPELEAEGVVWVRYHAQRVPDLRTQMDRMMRFVSTMEADSVPADQLLDVLFDATDFASGTFFRTFDVLLAALSEDLQRMEQTLDRGSADTTERTRGALARISKVNRMVRLIALNASVEAARVGDAGRGFGVIAAEMKTLAEEITDASSAAETCLSQLQSMILIEGPKAGFQDQPFLE